MKIRFAIIGSGWRSLYYVRIAQRLPELFELCGMYCRTEEKAEKIRNKNHIHTVTSEEEIEAMSPDFIVSAVNKASVAEVTLHWLEKGYPVLAETPCALDRQTLKKLYALHAEGKKLVIAEQYRKYPTNIARKKILDSGLIGEPHYVYLSQAHEYHGASLMRQFLNISCDMPFTVRAKEFRFPTVETLSRFEAFHDGRVTDKKRMTALLEFANGKACLYDFDSEQYRSPIRADSIRIQGVRGELNNSEVTWLDETWQPQKGTIRTGCRRTEYDDENPNLRFADEVTEIALGQEVLYTPPFGLRGLTEDETAMAVMMKEMGEYVNGGEPPYPLEEALRDAWTGILMKEAAESGELLSSEEFD